MFEADVEALVNAVNCVGYMGKGIALRFRKMFPDNFGVYKRACLANEVRPGRLLIFYTGSFENPRFIINFPTKRHWRDKSRITDIEAGLESLVFEVRRMGITSIAVPALGCGLGGLSWDDVRPLIERAFEKLSDVDLFLYEPW